MDPAIPDTTNTSSAATGPAIPGLGVVRFREPLRGGSTLVDTRASGHSMGMTQR
jgi:hypothetical protein